MTKHLTPCQAIKQYCKYDCCANDMPSWKECSRLDCALFPYRFGKRGIKTQVKQDNQENKQDNCNKQAKLTLSFEGQEVL